MRCLVGRAERPTFPAQLALDKLPVAVELIKGTPIAIRSLSRVAQQLYSSSTAAWRCLPPSAHRESINYVTFAAPPSRPASQQAGLQTLGRNIAP